MRHLFADGWNSFWHVVFGCLSKFLWWINPVFSAYQLMDPFEKNIIVDFSEFFIGYNLIVFGLFVIKSQQYNHSIEFMLNNSLNII